jgi:soluble P-type ATPase
MRPYVTTCVTISLSRSVKQVKKTGVLLDIPGLGRRKILLLITDYTGTLSLDGKLTAGVREALSRLSEKVDLKVITADTFGTAAQELTGLRLKIHRLKGPGGDHDLQKRRFLNAFDARSVVALGNGNNDRLLLKSVKEAGGLAIAVENGEGCAADAIQSANMLIFGASNALNLLLRTDRLRATLRF